MQTNNNTRATTNVHSGTRMGIVELLRLSVLALGLATPLIASLAHAADQSRPGPSQAKTTAEHAELAQTDH